MPQRKQIAFVLFALTLLAALPALAASAPTPAATAPAGCPTTLAASTTDPGASLFGDFAPQSAAAATALPAWLDLGPQAATSTTVYHGYCHCTCSRIPDCNTNADCSNNRCLGGISCC